MRVMRSIVLVAAGCLALVLLTQIGQAQIVTAPGNVWRVLSGGGVATAGPVGIGTTGLYADGLQAVNVRALGATGDGVTDDTAAIQAAIAAAAATGGAKAVWLPAGTYLVSGLTVPSYVQIQGVGASSVLSYTGTGSAISSATAGVSRVYGWRLRDFKLQTSTGAIGLDLSDVSTSEVSGVSAQGFSTVGVLIDSSTSGWAVYNRFYDVTVTSCANGWRVYGPSSNANVFVSCRANAFTGRGWDIQDSNDNSVIASQIEGTGVAFYVDAAAPSTSSTNRLISSRIEGGAELVRWSTGANVSGTVVAHNWIDSTAAAAVDAGTNTLVWQTTGSKVNGLTSASPIIVADGVVANPGFAFSGSTSTGWYRNSGGALAAAVNGSPSMTIGGATNAMARNLQITGAGNTIKLAGYAVYADNAAALAGGLVAGDHYRTTTGVVMVVYTP